MLFQRLEIPTCTKRRPIWSICNTITMSILPRDKSNFELPVRHLSSLERALQKERVLVNLKLADLNEQISTINDKYVNSIEGFNQVLEKDFTQVKDAIMKYFVYQTSFLKNTEYDANNIILVRFSRLTYRHFKRIIRTMRFRTLRKTYLA